MQLMQQNNLQSLSSFLPELIIIFSIIMVIISDLIPSIKKYTFIFTLVGIFLTALMLYIVGHSDKTLFNNMIIDDSFSYFFKFLILLSTFSIILVSKYNIEIDDEYRPEYNALILIVMLGLFLMTSSINLIMIYLSLELVSIPSYVLAGILKNNKKSNEASLKYVIFGSFASGLMLFGFSLLYGIAGSTDLTIVHDAIVNVNNQSMLLFAIVLILVGFGYKISMVPFHYWTPDVYEGAPITITAYLSVAPKAAGFALFLRVFFMLFTDTGTFMSTNFIGSVDWPFLIAILSAATMTLGNVLALRQDNVKRLLAYSTISHVGFMLMALCSLNILATSGIMFYLLMYVFMNLSAFYMVIFVSNKLKVETIEEWKGLGYKNPVLCFFMVLL